MRSWFDRAIEEASLFNPLFCGLCLHFACSGYKDMTDDGLPFALAFVVLPLTLHANTRRRLPKSTRTSVAAWLEDNPEALLGFSKRCRAMVPYTREAILVGLSLDLFHVSRGCLEPNKNAAVRRSQLKKKLSKETQECFSKSGFIGGWISTTRGAQPAMTMFGLRP
jgi:hypothetical protein